MLLHSEAYVFSLSEFGLKVGTDEFDGTHAHTYIVGSLSGY